MKVKEFHLGDVLSVTSGWYVTSKESIGVYDILNFMTNDKLNQWQVPYAIEECKPFLLKQFPILATNHMEEAIEKLSKIWEARENEDDLKNNYNITATWVNDLISGKYGIKYPKTLKVKQLPKGVHDRRNRHPLRDPFVDIITFMKEEKKRKEKLRKKRSHPWNASKRNGVPIKKFPKGTEQDSLQWTNPNDWYLWAQKRISRQAKNEEHLKFLTRWLDNLFWYMKYELEQSAYISPFSDRKMIEDHCPNNLIATLNKNPWNIRRSFYNIRQTIGFPSYRGREELYKRWKLEKQQK